MKVDVVMPTRNSGRFLQKVLNSVYKEVPICHLIVLDGFSTDNTIKIVRQFPNTKVIETKEGLGKCREKGIQLADTEWFVFVDSDVVLREGWFSKVWDCVSHDIGVVEGWNYNVNPPRRAYQEAMVNLRKKLGKDPHSGRPFTGDTLIRTLAVKGISIPLELDVYEDRYIKQYVQNRGYGWARTKEYVCDHYDFKPPSRTELSGEIASRMGYLPLRRAVLNLATALPKSLYAFYLTREVSVLPFQLSWDWHYLKGCLRGNVRKRII